jgi:hypothetical protein
MKRSAPLRRSAPIRRVSKKRAAQLREYSKLRAAFLREHPVCELWLHTNNWVWHGVVNGFARYWQGDPEFKTGTLAGEAHLLNLGAAPATEVHHKNKRHGSRLNDTTEWCAVSRRGHEFIEANKRWARENGFLRNI